MEDTIKELEVIQIFQGTDLRGGDQMLSALVTIHGYFSRNKLKNHQVYVFINRARNIMKVLGKRGMYIDRLPDNQTFDFTLRREQVFESIGKCFGISFDVRPRIYKQHKEAA